MSNLEPPLPQSSWGDACREESAEAAHRELFEFFATSEAAPSVAPDLSRVPDESPGAASPHVAHASRADSDAEACEHAARSAARALDEATKENLRRLEATMSRLQNEARHLPRTPQLAPVQGVRPVQAQRAASPAFGAVIDRSSLHRTVHGSTVDGTLPIWLREHKPPIQLPPPRRRGRELWQRIVKLFWACAVAAPIAYVFAITTSPLHKHLVDFSLSLPTLYSGHAPSRGRDLIAIAPIVASEGNATVAASGATAQAAIPSDTVVVSVAAAAPEVAAASSDADRASAPEAAHAQPYRLASIGVGESSLKPAPAPAGEPDAAAKPAARQDLSGLTEQGKQFFELGDLVAARIMFGRAAKAGDAAAAVAMGATYDPVMLAERGLRGVAADLDQARAWYERAKEMGSSEGPRRLEMLANR